MTTLGIVLSLSAAFALSGCGTSSRAGSGALMGAATDAAIDSLSANAGRPR